MAEKTVMKMRLVFLTEFTRFKHANHLTLKWMQETTREVAVSLSKQIWEELINPFHIMKVFEMDFSEKRVDKQLRNTVPR